MSEAFLNYLVPWNINFKGKQYRGKYNGAKGFPKQRSRFQQRKGFRRRAKRDVQNKVFGM
jgi:hypothetical protein